MPVVPYCQENVTSQELWRAVRVRKWSQDRKWSQTANDPQIGPQMIPDRKWSRIFLIFVTSRFFHSAVVQNEQVPVVTFPLFCAIKGVPSSCLEKKQTINSWKRHA